MPIYYTIYIHSKAHTYTSRVNWMKLKNCAYTYNALNGCYVFPYYVYVNNIFCYCTQSYRYIGNRNCNLQLYYTLYSSVQQRNSKSYLDLDAIPRCKMQKTSFLQHCNKEAPHGHEQDVTPCEQLYCKWCFPFTTKSVTTKWLKRWHRSIAPLVTKTNKERRSALSVAPFKIL